MRREYRTLVMVILLSITLPAIAFSQSDITQTPEQAVTPSGDVYIIGSGDVLEIVTWKEPDFSREEIVVRLDGNISFPLLDDVAATGRTPIQLKMDIQKGLKEYVSEPHVTVTVRSALSKRFYILGEVVNTGEYQMII